jgi:hypothetical protein
MLEEIDSATRAPPGGRTFVAACYEVFLGRELDSPDVAEERGSWPVRDILRSIIGSEEFADAAAWSLRHASSFPSGIFREKLSLRHKYWICDWLPIQRSTREVVHAADDWRAVLSALVADEHLMQLAGCPSMTDLPPFSNDDPLLVESGDRDEHYDLVILGGVDRIVDARRSD